MTREEKQQRREEIVRRGRAGEQNKAIALDLGVHESMISKVLTAAGIRRRIPQRARKEWA